MSELYILRMKVELEAPLRNPSITSTIENNTKYRFQEILLISIVHENYGS
jgi:hypothetical protein